MNRLLHTPEGVRDIYDGEYRKKLTVIDQMNQVLDGRGYIPIQTPTFEYFDIFSREIGTTPSKDLYKFFDREGNTLVLRPDFTPAIARTAAKYFTNVGGTIRLTYNGNVFINNSSYQGRLKENTQLGAELIGDNSIDSDSEMIEMLIKSLQASGLTNFQISIGHSDVFRGLMDAAGFDEEAEGNIRDLINNKNSFGLEEYISSQNLSDDLTELFGLLSSMYASPKEWEQYRKKADGYPVIAKALDYLCQLDEKLMECKVNSFVSYELGLISNYTYYTGIIFSGYAFGTGEPIAKGGRYDKLLSYFGKDAAAIGFAISVDDLMEALNSQAVDTKTSDGVRYLTIALGKGRLADKAMAYFEKIGLPCEEMKDKNTRKLIFVNEEKKVRFFLAKGPDVPTYVEYGAADIGIVGEDTILEEARNIFEVLDLGFGKCRMCVCGPQSAKPLLENQELIRVATKYPKIAKDYFYNKKHQTVEIIKLNGSIELAPIVGLSEVICDIVETGSTLRENGLVVLEEVCDLSARMVVNQVSMKMENERITEIIRALKKVTEE
jgi:ATP phosphoribosyltransferase regulatory subunit/ATP phosphoribosyltransferase